jgi:hypothetical protein
MNVIEISPEATPIWLYFAIALLLTFVSLAATRYWKKVANQAKWWNYIHSVSARFSQTQVRRAEGRA